MNLLIKRELVQKPALIFMEKYLTKVCNSCIITVQAIKESVVKDESFCS